MPTQYSAIMENTRQMNEQTNQDALSKQCLNHAELQSDGPANIKKAQVSQMLQILQPLHQLIATANVQASSTQKHPLPQLSMNHPDKLQTICMLSWKPCGDS